MANAIPPSSAALDAPVRLQALRRLALLDAPPHAALDELAALAASVLETPMAFVTLVDDRRQFFTSAHGLPEPWAARRETPLTHSFCQYVVTAQAPLAIPDARLNPLVCDSLAIPELGVLAYLGHPVGASDGSVLGSLAVADTAPRAWTARDRDRVAAFARIATRELALVEAAHRAATVLAEAPDATLTLDGSGRITSVNRAAEALLGHPARLLVGRSVHDALPAALVDALAPVVSRGMVEGRLADLEVRVAARDGPGDREGARDAGPPTVLEARVLPWREGTAVFLRDVTAHREAEAARERLLEAERRAHADAERGRMRAERIAALAEALAEARTLRDVAAAILIHGRAVAGADAGAVVRLVPEEGSLLEILDTVGFAVPAVTPWARFPVQPADASADAPVACAIRTRAPVLTRGLAETVARFPAVQPLAESTGYHSWLAVPFLLGDQAVGGFGLAFREEAPLSADDHAALQTMGRQCALALERVRLDEAERAARLAAEAANRAKSDFLAVMSHELRTPLNAISGHVQLVELGLHGPVTPAQAEALGRVQKAQRHLLGLITDLLQHARLEAGKVEYDIRETRVAEAIADVLLMMEPQARAKGIALAVSLPEDAARGAGAIDVWADPDKLAQVFLNLLSNAVKFTPAPPGQAVSGQDGPPGRVTVSLEAAPDRPDLVCIHVRDTGIGIPPDRQTSIFDPFVQVRSGLTRPQEGTGLGLAISRDLVRGMGGELTVTSTEGQGATFTVRLRRVVTEDGHRTERRDRAARRRTPERRTPERRPRERERPARPDPEVRNEAPDDGG